MDDSCDSIRPSEDLSLLVHKNWAQENSSFYADCVRMQAQRDNLRVDPQTGSVAAPSAEEFLCEAQSLAAWIDDVVSARAAQVNRDFRLHSTLRGELLSDVRLFAADAYRRLDAAVRFPRAWMALATSILDPGTQGIAGLDTRLGAMIAQQRTKTVAHPDLRLQAVAGAGPDGGPMLDVEGSAENALEVYASRWSLSHAGRTIEVPTVPIDGIRAIAYLLSIPNGRPSGGAAEVLSVIRGPRSEAPEVDSLAAARAHHEGLAVGLGPSEAGSDLSDDRSLAEYEERITKIEAALKQDDDGELDLPDGARQRLEAERESLEKERARSSGLRGRTRKRNRPENTVGAAIKRAKDLLRDSHPVFCRHLDEHLKEIYGDNIHYDCPKGTFWSVSMK